MKNDYMQNLDPRTKMAMIACISTVSVISKDVYKLLSIFIFTILLLFILKIPLKRLKSQLKSAIQLVITIFIIQIIFSRAGEPLLTVKGFTLITKYGLELALIFSTRILIIIFSALLLYGDSRDYLLALTQMKVPYELAFMVMISIRFLPTLREEALDVYYSIQMRGTDLNKKNFIEKMSTYIKICLPILVAALNRSKNMAVAMEIRGFRIYSKRTYMRRLVLHKKDWFIIIIFFICTLIYVYKIFM